MSLSASVVYSSVNWQFAKVFSAKFYIIFADSRFHPQRFPAIGLIAQLTDLFLLPTWIVSKGTVQGRLKRFCVSNIVYRPTTENVIEA